jgi:hypothetical protein
MSNIEYPMSDTEYRISNHRNIIFTRVFFPLSLCICIYVYAHVFLSSLLRNTDAWCYDSAGRLSHVVDSVKDAPSIREGDTVAVQISPSSGRIAFYCKVFDKAKDDSLDSHSKYVHIYEYCDLNLHPCMAPAADSSPEPERVGTGASAGASAGAGESDLPLKTEESSAESPAAEEEESHLDVISADESAEPVLLSDEWNCPVCTVLNPNSALMCGLCEIGENPNPNPAPANEPSQDPAANNSASGIQAESALPSEEKRGVRPFVSLQCPRDAATIRTVQGTYLPTSSTHLTASVIYYSY